MNTPPFEFTSKVEALPQAIPMVANESSRAKAKEGARAWRIGEIQVPGLVCVKEHLSHETTLSKRYDVHYGVYSYLLTDLRVGRVFYQRPV